MNSRWLFAALLGAGLLAACQRDAPQEETATAPSPATEATGEPAGPGGASTGTTPALQVTTIDGDAWDLADHRGSWVVVNYWATWCAPCREEMPELSALASMRGHIEVIGLAYEDTTPEAIGAFLEQYPVTYPIAIIGVLDPPADFDVPRGLPMTWLIGPDGRVARRFLGPVSALEIETAIAEAGGPEVPEQPAEAGS